MKTNINYDKLTEVLGKPGLVVTETKSNPTSEKLKTKDYLEAEAYSYDYDNVLIEKRNKTRRQVINYI